MLKMAAWRVARGRYSVTICFDNKQRIAVFGLLAAMALASACVKQPEVIRLHEVPQGFDKQFTTLLVVSVASDVGQRRRLEELLSNELALAGVYGVASYTETGLRSTILQNALDRAALKIDADGILMTHIVSVDSRLDLEEGQTEIMSECRGGDPIDVFLYDRYELKEPDNVRLAHTVVAIANLYDVASDQRIWTIQSTCFDKDTMDEVLQEEAVAIVRQLVKDGLVAGGSG